MNQSAERMPSGAMSDEPAGVGDACERRNPLLETALFKQVSEEQARELVPYLHHEGTTRASTSSPRATPTSACM